MMMISSNVKDFVAIEQKQGSSCAYSSDALTGIEIADCNWWSLDSFIDNVFFDFYLSISMISDWLGICQVLHDCMQEWFYDNFSEPAIAEGENIFVAGGPFEPGTKLWAKFGDAVSDEVYKALTKELENTSLEWDGKLS
jgi:hypothetical protein